jgi:hypothetical protein
LTKTEAKAIRSAQMVNDLKKSVNIDKPASLIKEKHDNNIRQLILHYKHEKALKYFRREFHKLWDNTFGQTSAGDIRVIVGTLINRSLSSLLVRKCPPMSMLRLNNDNKKNNNPLFAAVL